MDEAKSQQFPIVGIGASAGGIEALERLLRPIPPDVGVAFVIVTHLSPARRSLLHEIVGHFTRMSVSVATDGMVVAPNEVYVLAENAILGIENGILRVRQQVEGKRERKPIDVFLSELALDQNDYSVGIILSGGDGDGALGIKAIKERGGLTLAQTGQDGVPLHADMPDTAIATGHIDFAISAEEMGDRIAQYARSFDLFDEAHADKGDDAVRSAQEQIYQLLREQIGHDFSGYKTRTFNRRVFRRMQVLQLDNFESYVERLRQEPSELNLLFRDLLINVTSFFRDPDAFEALQTLAIPKLFEGRGANDTVRIWVPGCATGEEVYSIAILAREHMLTLKGVPRVQIFATDIDEHSLTIARAGRYTAGLLDSVSPERRARFFTADGASFVLVKEVRDLCIFSPHSVIRDPPFSRMDMISCRNLLIYFGSEVQSHVIPTFHYALKPGGYLFLGTSENITLFSDSFTSVDKRNRIYRAREGAPSRARVPLTFESLRSVFGSEFDRRGKLFQTTPLRENVEAHVLDRFSPPHVVVDVEGDIVYYSSRTGKYLEAAPGAPSRQLLAVARKGLRLDLRTALREAMESGRPTIRDQIALESDENRIQMVTITVEPMPKRNEDGKFFIVLFTETSVFLSDEQAKVRSLVNSDETVRDLERELRESRDRLQSMIEEYETALEELKSSNEELVSVNEELQSTNEELEASKEELHSLNEELQTVNLELISKVDALDRSNSDLHNLFESTQIATIFLDQDLTIRHFTPPMAKLFNILPSDRGRSFSDLSSRLTYPDLHEDIRRSLTQGTSFERRVPLVADQRSFAARIVPYQSPERSIEGVVCTFFDVTGLAESEVRLKELTEEIDLRSKNMLSEVANVARDTLTEAPSPRAFNDLLVERLKIIELAYTGCPAQDE